MSTSASSERGPADPGAAEPSTASRASSLFDLRLLIGALFVVYGVILTIVGLIDPDRRGKNPGNATLNINLWTGIGMLVTGLVFLLWWRTRPLVAEPHRDEPGPGSGRS